MFTVVTEEGVQLLFGNNHPQLVAAVHHKDDGVAFSEKHRGAVRMDALNRTLFLLHINVVLRTCSSAPTGSCIGPGRTCRTRWTTGCEEQNGRWVWHTAKVNFGRWARSDERTWSSWTSQCWSQWWGRYPAVAATAAPIKKKQQQPNKQKTQTDNVMAQVWKARRGNEVNVQYITWLTCFHSSENGPKWCECWKQAISKWLRRHYRL